MFYNGWFYIDHPCDLQTQNPLTDSPGWPYFCSWPYTLKSPKSITAESLKSFLSLFTVILLVLGGMFLPSKLSFPLPLASCLMSSPPAVTESSYCSPGSHFWCREKTTLVAIGTWFLLIHSLLLGYFQSTHPNNQALNLDLTTPLLEEQSVISHVFYFTYRFLRLRLKIFHSLVQTRQESPLLTVSLECWLCSDFIPIHSSSSVIDCFRIAQS